MSDVVLQRWARYGHDRTYVETAGGRRLGYWDNKKCSAHPQDVTEQQAFYAALTAAGLLGSDPQQLEAVVPTRQRGLDDVAGTGTHPADVRPASAAGQPSADGTLTASDMAEPRQDLTSNRAGAAVRAQAKQARAEAPIKTALARLFGVHTDERAWRLGADAEEAVAKRLSKLDKRWRVLHSVPVGAGASDIDHVVIGPGGVFTVNAKNHPDASIWVGGNTFLVNGQRVPYIRNSRHEARRAARLLTEATGIPVIVTGIVAVYGAAGGFTVKQQPPDGEVAVMTRRKIAKWLSRRPETLASDQIETIHAHARRPATWTAIRRAAT